MSTDRPWNKVLFEAADDLRTLTYTLDRLGGAMRTLGMNEGGKELRYAADEMRRKIDDIRTATSNAIAERVLAAEQSSNNMVRAAIAVAQKKE